MLGRRGIELDVEFNASAWRHHDRVRAALGLRPPRFVGERYAVEARDLDRNAPRVAGAVDVGEVQPDVGVRRRIDETPKLLAAGSDADLGQGAAGLWASRIAIPLRLRNVSCSGAEH